MRVIRHPLALLAVAAVGFLPVLAGCGGDNDESKPAATTSTTPTTTTAGNVNDHGTKNFARDGEGEVELDDNYFAPTVIQGRAGQSLRLELRNEGNAEHNLTLTEQNIDADVEAGEDTKVNVRVPRSGKVEFFCKYHRAQGMAGSLAATGESGDGSPGGSGSGGSGSGSSGGGSSGGGSSGGGSDGSSGGYGY